MKLLKEKQFENGRVFLFETDDGFPIETTDTFLPNYTKDLINTKTNQLNTVDLGNRNERWMIGVSVMSGCPVKCKFCATGQLKKYRNLRADEIVEQVNFIIKKNKEYLFVEANEHKINYTRMGEPFLNIHNVIKAIEEIEIIYPQTHHYISTIGIQNSDFTWIKDNITLQISVHSTDDLRRNILIPFQNKMSIKELGQIRTKSNLKTTVNLTLIDYKDFDIEKLKEYFDPKFFFIKLSPINTNIFSETNECGDGIIKSKNLI